MTQPRSCHPAVNTPVIPLRQMMPYGVEWVIGLKSGKSAQYILNANNPELFTEDRVRESPDLFGIRPDDKRPGRTMRLNDKGKLVPILKEYVARITRVAADVDSWKDSKCNDISNSKLEAMINLQEIDFLREQAIMTERNKKYMDRLKKVVEQMLKSETPSWEPVTDDN
jgi:hypothetical protein